MVPVVRGPGHWWPDVLVPVYALLRAVPVTREGTTRRGLVTHAQMIEPLVHQVAHSLRGAWVMDMPGFRRGGA